MNFTGTHVCRKQGGGIGGGTVQPGDPSLVWGGRGRGNPPQNRGREVLQGSSGWTLRTPSAHAWGQGGPWQGREPVVPARALSGCHRARHVSLLPFPAALCSAEGTEIAGDTRTPSGQRSPVPAEVPPRGPRATTVTSGDPCEPRGLRDPPEPLTGLGAGEEGLGLSLNWGAGGGASTQLCPGRCPRGDRGGLTRGHVSGLRGDGQPPALPSSRQRKC